MARSPGVCTCSQSMVKVFLVFSALVAGLCVYTLVFDHEGIKGYLKYGYVEGITLREVRHRQQVAPVCRKKWTHFVFITVAKTGSTTLSTILRRFAREHGLTIAVPNDGLMINWTKPLGSKSCDNKKQTRRKVEAVIDHSFYSQSIYDKYFVPDVRYIFPIRHPVSWIKSAAKFFPQKHAASFPAYLRREKNPAEAIIRSKKLLMKTREQKVYGDAWFVDVQLQWYGFNYSLRKNISAIRSFAKRIVDRADIILLNEQYDASLIQLRRRFCWSLQDIFYENRVVTNSSSTYLSETSINRYLSLDVSLGDLILYEALNSSWWSQPEVKLKDFWDEVEYFKRINKKVTTHICPKVHRTGEVYTIRRTKWHDELHVGAEYCRILVATTY